MFDIDALQTGFLIGGSVVVACFLLLIVLRWLTTTRSRNVDAAVAHLEPILHRWLVFDSDPSQVRDALRAMAPAVALRSLTRLAAHQATFERLHTLARALRHEPWVATILRRVDSPFWWRRFDAGRLLSVVGMGDDREMIARLMVDRNAAVRLVAMDAAARLPGRPLIDLELETLPYRQDAVQAYQMAALSRSPAIAGDALIKKLESTTPLLQLMAWIDVAGAIANAKALEKVRELATHESADVRLHVARALRRLADPGTPPVLIRLLEDEDWRVRAQAARALGALRVGAAEESLRHAVQDRSWWVRYRSALALAQIGGTARTALWNLAKSDDAMARDMSILVASLSSAAVVEMSEV